MTQGHQITAITHTKLLHTRTFEAAAPVLGEWGLRSLVGRCRRGLSSAQVSVGLALEAGGDQRQASLRGRGARGSARRAARRRGHGIRSSSVCGSRRNTCSEVETQDSIEV